MKKLFFTTLCAGLLVFATSCKKDYVCDCPGYEESEDGVTFTVDPSSYEINDAKKKDAEKACDELSTVNQAFGAGACELK